jgi:SBF-like CPA transporter family (DUF4137)
MLFEYVGAYFALNVRGSGAKYDFSSTGGFKNKNAMGGSNLLSMSAERYYINTSSRPVSAGVRNICDANTLKRSFADRRQGSQRSRSRATHSYCSSPGSSSDAITVSESDEEVVPLLSDSDSNSIKSEEEVHHVDAHSAIGSPNIIIGEQNLQWSMPESSDGSKINQKITTEKSPQPPKIITKTQVIVGTPPPIVKPNAFKTFIKGNWLVIGEIMVIMLARLNPAFGATGGRLRPEFFVSKLGVFTIFFINGIALSIGTIN